MRIYGLFILSVPPVPHSLNYIRAVQTVKHSRQTQFPLYATYNVFSVFPLILAVITRKISMK